MMFSKKKRRVTRFVFGWMMSGYLVALVALGTSSIIFVPQEAEAVDVCIMAGACFTEAACGEIEGSEWRGCSNICAADKEHGCGKCRANEGYCFPPRKGIELAIHVGDTKRVYDTSQYLESVYDFAIGIAGGIAGVMLMIGGFQYLTAGGAADRVSAAKKRISDALVGLALTLGAFLILNTISPDLVNMSELRVPMIQKKTFVACNKYIMDKPCGEEFGLAGEPPVPVDGTECVGMNCKTAGFDNEYFVCENSGKTHEQVPPKFPVAPYWCETCLAYGASCTDRGVSDQCCTTFCASGTCRTGEVGDECANDSDCKDGMCQTRLGNSCSTGLVGQPCNDDNQCKDGNVCIETAGVYVCQPQLEGAWCEDEEDCPGNAKCKLNACTGQDGELERCSNNSDCAKYDKPLCPVGSWFSGNAPCSLGIPGSPCDEDEHCRTTGPTGYNGFCVDNAIITTVGPEGMCTDGSIGSRCDDNDQCILRHCFKKGDFGVCTAGELWDGCENMQDCNPAEEANLKCDTNNFRCVVK